MTEGTDGRGSAKRLPPGECGENECAAARGHAVLMFLDGLIANMLLSSCSVSNIHVAKLVSGRTICR